MKNTGKFLIISVLAALLVLGGCSEPEQLPITSDISDTVAVTGVSLKTSINLVVGGTETLIANISPDNATNKNVTWNSSDKTIATVSEDGEVTAVGVGTAQIIIATRDGGYTAMCTVTVSPLMIPVTGVYLKPSTYIATGGKETLYEYIEPNNATNKSVTWDSSNNNVATVSENGEVTAVLAGTTTITVTTDDGWYQAECKVNVSNATVPVTDISLKTSANLEVNSTEILLAAITPNNATNQNLTWSSSNENIVTISKGGVINAKKIGTATITVTTDDGGKKAYCNITVTPKIIIFTIDAIPNQIYTGSAISPVVIVKDGATTLAKDTDYNVLFNNNVDEGTAMVTVIGKGNYAGSSGSATFNIIVPTFTSISEFNTWLSAQPANTASNPYHVKLNVSDLGGSYGTNESVGYELGYFYYSYKYVALDISGSTFTSIGDAFNNCTGLTSVTIGSGVTSIGDGAFDCRGLTAINVDPSNSAYTAENGVLYNKNKTTLIIYPKGKTGVFTIPNSVTSIGDSAFYSCTGLTSVTIGNSVTSIGERAFYNCYRLTSVTIPNSVTSIGDYAFYNCTGMTSITIGNSVTSIGDYAFYCIGLTSITIPNSVTSIGDWAFYNCTGLTEINYNATAVTDLNGGAFVSAGKNAAGITVNIGANVTKIPAHLFYGYSLSSCNITAVNFATGSVCQSIGDWAFRNCTEMTSITIPNSVTSIGNNAFCDCSGLTSITIGNSVTSIGNYAFYDCTGLTSVTIPNSVTSIGDHAFYDCTGLTSVTIGNSVTSIDAGAFSGCTGLTNVTFATGSNITDSNFRSYAFPEGSYGDGGNTLKTAYSAANPKAGTYTRASGGGTWTKVE